MRILLLAEQYPRPDAVKTGGDQRLVGNLVHLIAGELFHHEAVVWFVGVKRVDHIVAILPRIGTVVVVDVARAVGIACHVQPMPAPTLAIVW